MRAWHVQVQHRILPNGLHLYLVDRPGSRVQFLKLMVRYGSVHTRFRPDPEAEWRQLPSATAHFLEHVLFRETDETILTRFQELGATANGGVSYTSTSFDVLCVDKLEPCLTEMINVVCNAEFPAEGVDLEREIIGQEIDIWGEHPDWLLEQAVLQGLYQCHPIREPLLGTREQLEAIGQRELSAAHEAFYRAGNMNLVVVAEGAGDDRTVAMIEQICAALPRGAAPEVAADPEPEQVAAPQVTVRAVGVNPRFVLGFKDTPTGMTGRELARREALVELAGEWLFGRASPVVHRLMGQGLLDGVPELLSECHADLGFCLVQGGSADPLRALAALREEIGRMTGGHLVEAQVERARRQLLGEVYMRLDDPQNAGYVVGELHLRGASLDNYLQALTQVSAEELVEFARGYFHADRACQAALLVGEE